MRDSRGNTDIRLENTLKQKDLKDVVGWEVAGSAS